MEFHFRNTKEGEQARNMQAAGVYKPMRIGRENSFWFVIRKYLQIRIRQIRIIGILSFRFSGVLTEELKNMVVRNMYWGRTSFYRQAFHLMVIFITLSALYSGVGARIINTEAEQLENISVAARTSLDVDLVAQQGSLTPLQALGEETDSVYTEYTVKQGDSLEKIANDNGINVDTIRWANDIPAGRDTLKVGAKIRVPKMNGVLYEVEEGDSVDEILGDVKLNDKEADRFTFLELNADNIDGEGRPITGRIVFIPEAEIETPPAPVVARTPGRTVVNQPAPSASVPSGTFVNPMQQTSYSYSRGYSFGHTGVDLGTNSGSWIVAAGSGTVVRANWCFSLGYCVVIRHSGGLSTLYGHGNGVFAVSAGQSVVAGQRIMQSGCTGLCFGPHLHLSLAANGNDVYSCYRCRINPAGIIPY
ncbi:MAG: peptidoglycan DD-metalloendopeptidase family protein [Candidatus Dojkabacteria bacterium]